MLLAAAALFDAEGALDVSVAFSSPIGAHPASEWGNDAYAVGFRGSHSLWLVVVDLDGNVRDINLGDSRASQDVVGGVRAGIRHDQRPLVTAHDAELDALLGAFPAR